MSLELRRESSASLSEYAAIPIAFAVGERLEVTSDSNGFSTRIVSVNPPFLKDYDAIPNECPLDWPRTWDIRDWCLAAAYWDGVRIGGATMIPTPEDMAGEIADPGDALLTDLRITPAFRNRGVGKQLLTFVEVWARESGRMRMKVETQDINVPACRLYAKAGYTLQSVDRFAYPTLPDESRLVWVKRL